MVQRHFHNLFPSKTSILLISLIFSLTVNAGDVNSSKSSEDESQSDDDSQDEKQSNNPDPSPNVIDEKPSADMAATLDEADLICDSGAVKKKMLKRVLPVVILVAKGALDSYQMFAVIQQINATNNITVPLTNLPMGNCSVICNSNVAGLRDFQYKSNVSNITSLIFHSLSAVGDVSALISYLKGGSKHLATLGLSGCVAVCDIIKCLCSFSANGYLWNAEQRFLGDLPASVTQALKKAIEAGVPPLVASCLEAVPAGIVIGAIYFCF